MNNAVCAISIIIPIYNAASYLDRCIQSVLAQDFSNYELLLINDGSTDESGIICDHYDNVDARVRVFHKENGGVSSARNLGLSKSVGRWIVFIDSDDWVESSYLSSLYSAASGSDLILCSFQYEKRHEVITKELGNKIIHLNAVALKDILMDAAFMIPWAKMYRKDIIESNLIRFDDNIYSGEDTLFVYTYLLYTSNITTINAIQYHYCIQDEGLSNRRISVPIGLYTLDCFYNVLHKLENKYSGYDKTKRCLWMAYEYLIRFVSDLSNNNKETLKEIVNDKHIRSLLEDRKNFPKGLRRKIWDYLALNGLYSLLGVYVRLYKYD